jgi:multicomponent Na+:H+ antiporter subunit D
MSPLAPLPVAVPLAGAATILCLNTLLTRRAIQALSMATVFVEVGLAAALLHQTSSGTIVYWFGGWTPRSGVALGISFAVDQLGAGGAV